MRILVLGLGNPLLRDDSVGLRVARALKPALQERADIEVDEEYRGGLRLMERMIGYDRVLIVDAMRTGAAPGSLRRLTLGDMPTQHTASSHDVTLSTALEVGRKAGAQVPRPEDIQLIGIEVRDVETFGETLSPEVEAAIPSGVLAVLGALKRLT
jgi:hydrogenase maturation protease